MTSRRCPSCHRRFSADERFCPADGALLELVRPEPGSPGVQALAAGTLIGGRYRILRTLGSGAMGSVYLAFQESLRREVAIKFLLPELSRQLAEVRRFLLEARAAGKVDHPNVVSVFDFGRDPQGQYFLVMEYVTGKLLGDVIIHEGPLEQDRVIHILRQVLSAVAQAHRQNIIHRDLKPQNIICTVRRGDRDFVKVLDFGIAKILGDEHGGGPITEGVVIGTPEYMSPEQIEGKTVDHRCDLYSVGVMAYEMFSCVVPFDGSIDEIFRQHLRAEPRPLREVRPDLHPDVDFLVRTLMAKDRERRFARAEAVLNVIARISEDLGLVEKRGRIPRTPVEVPTVASGAMGSRPAPTTFLAWSPTSAWETPDLIAEIGRLAQLWTRRVSEVADALWGPDSRPPQVARWLADIRQGEQRITELETRLAVLEHEVESLDGKAHGVETALRMQRLDLVAKQGSVWAMLEDARTLGYDGAGEAEPTDEHTDPGVPNVVDEEAVATSVSITLPEHLEDRARGGASDTILTEYADRYDPDRSIETVESTQDFEHAQEEFVRLEREIAGLDERLRRVIEDHQRAVAEREQAILVEVGQVNTERDRLAPIYQELAGFVTRHADRRPDLIEDIGALEQVARAIRHHQLLLQQVQSG